MRKTQSNENYWMEFRWPNSISFPSLTLFGTDGCIQFIAINIRCAVGRIWTVCEQIWNENDWIIA